MLYAKFWSPCLFNFSSKILTWFLLKNSFTLVSTVFMFLKIGVKERLKVKEFGREEKLSLDDT